MLNKHCFIALLILASAVILSAQALQAAVQPNARNSEQLEEQIQNTWQAAQKNVAEVDANQIDQYSDPYVDNLIKSYTKDDKTIDYSGLAAKLKEVNDDKLTMAVFNKMIEEKVEKKAEKRGFFAKLFGKKTTVETITMDTTKLELLLTAFLGTGGNLFPGTGSEKIEGVLGLLLNASAESAAQKTNNLSIKQQKLLDTILVYKYWLLVDVRTRENKLADLWRNNDQDGAVQLLAALLRYATNDATQTTTKKYLWGLFQTQKEKQLTVNTELANQILSTTFFSNELLEKTKTMLAADGLTPEEKTIIGLIDNRPDAFKNFIGREKLVAILDACSYTPGNYGFYYGEHGQRIGYKMPDDLPPVNTTIAKTAFAQGLEQAEIIPGVILSFNDSKGNRISEKELDEMLNTLSKGLGIKGYIEYGIRGGYTTASSLALNPNGYVNGIVQIDLMTGILHYYQQ